MTWNQFCHAGGLFGRNMGLLSSDDGWDVIVADQGQTWSSFCCLFLSSSSRSLKGVCVSSCCFICLSLLVSRTLWSSGLCSGNSPLRQYNTKWTAYDYSLLDSSPFTPISISITDNWCAVVQVPTLPWTILTGLCYPNINKIINPNNNPHRIIVGIYYFIYVIYSPLFTLRLKVDCIMLINAVNMMIHLISK